MKPFNLERAIAGDPIVFKCGQVPYDIAWHPDARRFVGQIHKESYFYTWDEQGKMQKNINDIYDLLMASRTVTEWILLCNNDTKYTNQESAEDAKKNMTIPHLWSVHKIEYEE